MKVQSKKDKKVYTVVTHPSKILRKKTKQVQKVDPGLCRVLSTMVYTMYKNSGIGLAAPQVGLCLNMAVVDAGEGVYKLINPILIKKSGTDTMHEGCLSVPALLVSVKRPKTITVEYTNEFGKKVVKSFSGLTAKAIQHEMDHLKGKLIIDHMSWFRRMKIKMMNGK
jgi:peptide deformylase